MPIACVDLVIERFNSILLVRRVVDPCKGKWYLVGGRVMKGEYLEDAAKRIAFNETGLSVRVVQLLGTDETIFNADPFGHGHKTHTINHIYRCAAKGKNVDLDGTNSAYRWVDRGILKNDISISKRVRWFASRLR